MTQAERDQLAADLTVAGYVTRSRDLGNGEVLVYWTPADRSLPSLEDPSTFRVPGSFAEAIIRPAGGDIEWSRLYVARGAADTGIFVTCLQYAAGLSSDTVVAAGSPIDSTLQQAGFDRDASGGLRINKGRAKAWLKLHGG